MSAQPHFDDELSNKFASNPTQCPHCGSNDFVPAERHYDEDGNLHILHACSCNETWWSTYKPVVLGEY